MGQQYMNKLFAFAENPRHACFVLVLLGLAMFLPGFFSIPPIDRDEARFAQASKQMIETGDYLDIRYQQETRYKKPVGIYWLQVASTKVFGDPPYNQIWTYRIPSLFGALAALCLTYLIGRTLISAPVGFGAALLFASSLILSVEARLAKTDAMLLATILLAVWQLAKWYTQPLSRQKTGGRVLLSLGIAAGILIKGPIILIVIGGLITAWLLLDPDFRRGDAMKTFQPLRMLGIVLLCITPWLTMITIKSGGAFWMESVGHDMLGKVKSGQESHGLPPGAHLAFLFLLFLPAILSVTRGLFYAWKNRADKTVQFILAWIIPAWIVFEVTPTKLPHYLLPVYPAIAILAALAISKLEFTDRRVRLAFAIPVVMTLGLNMMLLGIVAPSLPDFWVAPQMQRISEDRDVIIAGYAEPSAAFLLGTATQLLATEAEARAALKDNPKAIVFVQQDDGMLKGFNIGRGKSVSFTIIKGSQDE
jgi:4-amino-4-deoxy-L-arabinose transferase-like glycosyltransferase